MRKHSYSVALRNEYLVERIKDIKAEHPFWGYRRVSAYLRYIDGLLVNEKRVYEESFFMNYFIRIRYHFYRDYA